jgi:AAA15 family ATPase/GTPase
MLIEFSVGNYRSFKERQTFSMVAGKTAGNAFDSGFKAAPRLLQSAAVFGANASGKSNLVKAIQFFQEFVTESAKDKNSEERIEEITPFLFSEKWARQPSEFEVVFVFNGSTYQYGFEVDQTHIYSEWLYATTLGGGRERTRTVFERDWNKKKKVYDYKWGSSSEVKETSFLEERTRGNALFLSMAMLLGSKDVVLESAFKWIKHYLRPVSANRFGPAFTTTIIKETDKAPSIVSMFKNADTSIVDFDVREKDFSEKDLPRDMPPSLKKDIVRELQGKKSVDVYAIHKTEDGAFVALDIEDESVGTRVLFGLSGPILDVLENGYTLVIDELDNSLHPLLLQEIVRLFSNPKTNKKKAQLVFTCHDTTILETMERDQVWLLEKGKFGESNLFSILKYKPREGENIRKGYLSGRYGGLPAIERLINGQA